MTEAVPAKRVYYRNTVLLLMVDAAQVTSSTSPVTLRNVLNTHTHTHTRKYAPAPGLYSNKFLSKHIIYLLYAGSEGGDAASVWLER